MGFFFNSSEIDKLRQQNRTGQFAKQHKILTLADCTGGQHIVLTVENIEGRQRYVTTLDISRGRRHIMRKGHTANQNNTSKKHGPTWSSHEIKASNIAQTQMLTHMFSGHIRRTYE
ncbi:hypothetical protein ILYODFUR_024328 [Ilyodon furcidens]|uniref:Uncharacterized protein n=1 Tax=Ilyodon furcidens TaxID=33524 RepID=A0ABV0VI64_9TELE